MGVEVANLAQQPEARRAAAPAAKTEIGKMHILAQILFLLPFIKCGKRSGGGAVEVLC